MKAFFNIKTAVILWILYTVLYGIAIYFSWIKLNSVVADIFGSLSWIVLAAAYICSSVAIIKTLLNKQLLRKQKLGTVLLLIAVYFISTLSLQIVFNDNIESKQQLLNNAGYKTELEEGDWSNWETGE